MLGGGGGNISIFSSDNHFIQWSRIFCAILIEGIIRNISVKYLEFGPYSDSGEYVFSRCFFLSSGSHFVQQRGTICAIVVWGFNLWGTFL